MSNAINNLDLAAAVKTATDNVAVAREQLAAATKALSDAEIALVEATAREAAARCPSDSGLFSYCAYTCGGWGNTSMAKSFREVLGLLRDSGSPTDSVTVKAFPLGTRLDYRYGMPNENPVAVIWSGDRRGAVALLAALDKAPA